VAAGAWAYATSFGGVFLLDDVRAIARNATIRTLWPITVPLAPPTASTVAGRPVANLSFAVNYALAPPDVRDVFEIGGPGSPPDAADRLRRNAWGYHAANLLIHLASALLLFGIVRRTLLTDRLRPVFGSDAAWVAAGTAVLWVVHPLTTAAVTYIVQRVESLMSLFYLLTLYAAIRASEGGRRWRGWAAAAIASCALGMGTKETMVGAPLVAGAWLRLFRPPAVRGEDRLLLGGLASTWLILATLVLGERRGPSLALDAGTAWRYLLTQAEVVTHYVRLALAPTSLAFLYDWPLVDSPAEVLPQASLLAGVAAAHAAGVWRRWPLAFPGTVFFLVLAPTSSILPIVTEVAAEHRMYLPLAALMALAVTGAYVAVRRAIRGRAWAAGVALAIAVAAGALGAETRARNREYWSEEAIWRDTVARRPADLRPRVAFGDALMRAGRLAEAEEQLRAAVELAPDDAVARVRLGAALARQGKVEEAAGHLERAASPPADDPAAHRLLGELYAAQGRDRAAVRHLERALPRMGDDAELLVRLAALLADSRDESVRDPARALGLAERAVALTGRHDARALAVLAIAQARSGRAVEAAATASDAIAAAKAQGMSPAFIEQLEALAGAAGPRRP
jgi:tetratricopeptide (TPR) repeat protein